MFESVDTTLTCFLPPRSQVALVLIRSSVHRFFRQCCWAVVFPRRTSSFMIFVNCRLAALSLCGDAAMTRIL